MEYDLSHVLCKCGCGTPLGKVSKATYWRITTNKGNAGWIHSHRSRGKFNCNWNDGEYQTSQGYKAIAKPDHPNARKNGYILEHRFVMSEYLGRPLLDDEIVHHLNENKLDNRIENLAITDRLEHYLEHDPNKFKRVVRVPKSCLACGKPFIASHGNHKRNNFCSQNCSRNATAPRGEKHHAAKVTEDVVRQIRELRKQGLSHQRIANAVQVCSRENVSYILRGDTWSHVV